MDAVLAEGGLLVIEGGAGIGKSALLRLGRERARSLGHQVLHARGAELESGFAFGVVRQLFEWHLAVAEREEGAASLWAGAASGARALFGGTLPESAVSDTSFTVVHGLYWLAVNLAARGPVLLAVDDVHWSDAPSLRWLAYLADRLEGLDLAVIVTLRPAEPVAAESALLAVRRASRTVVRPRLLSERAVARVAREWLGAGVGDEVCAALLAASGGNPFYLSELLRGIDLEETPVTDIDPAVVIAHGAEGVVAQLATRIRRLDERALAVAQACAVLGDGCELAHVARLARVDLDEAGRLAGGLVRVEVLGGDQPPRFLHPLVREAVTASMGVPARDAAHRAAARILHAAGGSWGQVAVHLVGTRPVGDEWVVSALRHAARDALDRGAPEVAADLLVRALAEPPTAQERVAVLREAARAEAAAGRLGACGRLDEALTLVTDRRVRAEIALETARTHACLFQWVEAVDAIDRALVELGDDDPELTARLEAELVVAGLHDARRASRVVPVVECLAARPVSGAVGEAVAVARGMLLVLRGNPALRAAAPLEDALANTSPSAENWDTRAALLWALITAERFEAVDPALEVMLAEAQRGGSARGLVAVYSALGLLRLRLGALPEAEAASRVALRVMQEGDLTPGLAFAVTVLSDVAVEAGQLDEADDLIALVPQHGWPAGVGTVLIPAARARLRLAQGRPSEALADFEIAARMFSDEVWGVDLRDVGYIHARSGAAMALLQLGDHHGARAMADAELADVQGFGAPRALGVALRAAGLTRQGAAGLALLEQSVAALRESPAVLERAHSLVEFGAAVRRAGRRVAAREPLAEALDLAARCGARPLASRAREELTASGARPRREWRRGVEALTPSELRIARLAAAGHTNREIAHQLYVTLKTVEGHLARAYDKLEIPGRAGLAHALRTEKPG